MSEVLGRRIELSGRRLVFFGTDASEPDLFYFGFRNEAGDDLKFRVSREAKDALRTLLTDPMAGMPLTDFPHQKVWQVVEFTDGNEVS